MAEANLIPADRLARKTRAARGRSWVLGCCAYAVLLTSTFAVCHGIWIRDNETVADQLDTVSQKIEKSGSLIGLLKAELAEARAALTASQAVGSQPDWSALLVLLSQKLGDQVVLDSCELNPLADADQPAARSAVRQDAPPAQDVPLAQRRYELNLSGFGRSQTAVLQFVLRLEKIDLFSEVKLTKSNHESFGNEHAVAFRIECSI